MKFVAEFVRGNYYANIVTDDYDEEEIKQRKHIKDLVRDLYTFDIKDPVRLFDENGLFIRYVTRDSLSPLELLV